MALSKADFDYVRALVRQRSAIVLDADKAYLAEARLFTLARDEGLASAEETGGPGAVRAGQRLAPEGAGSHDHQRDLVFPRPAPLRGPAAGGAARPGAAAGGGALPARLVGGLLQRPGAYSVAFLLREHFPALADWRLRLVASDVSAAMLERGRQGRYSQMEVNRGLPARLLVKYFTKDGADWVVKDEVRRRGSSCRSTWPSPGRPCHCSTSSCSATS